MHQPTGDSYRNFLTKTGIGTANLSSGGQYGFNPITRNRMQLEYMYRGSWVCGMAVDCVAEDMTRAGVTIQSTDKPDKIEQLAEEARTLQLWPALCDVVKWSRLYGGAVGMYMIDGQKPETPLKIDSIGKGSFKGILPLDRWMVLPNLTDLVTDYGPYFGLPKFYSVLPDSGGTPYMTVHYSRLLRIEGVRLPYWQRISEMLWGMSVIERLFDRLLAFDSATQGAAQMVYKAHLRTVKIEGLRDIIAAGGDTLKGLTAHIDMIRQMQSNEGLTLLDLKDEFQVDAYSFAGLDDVLLQFGQQLCGALQIPGVRLFGQSPAGLNSTGESDLRNYHEGIKQKQETYLRPGLKACYEMLYRSTYGAAPPKGFGLQFAALLELTDEQRGVAANQTTASVVDAFEAQLIDRQTALKELRQQAPVNGMWSNITDEQIEAAEDEPAPSPSEQLAAESAAAPKPGQEAKAGEDGNAPGGKKLRAVS